jgi:hypothetical protein
MVFILVPPFAVMLLPVFLKNKKQDPYHDPDPANYHKSIATETSPTLCLLLNP